MEIKAKYFPYPVLSDQTTDYQSSTFATDIDFEHKGHKIEFKFTAALQNVGLNELIKNQEAHIVFHIECPTTSFRRVFSLTEKNERMVSIDEADLNGKVEVATFVVATKTITDFSDPDFDQLFRSYQFDFEIGAILAVGNQFNIYVNKEVEELINVASIFKLVKSETISILDFDLSNDQIAIYLPNQDFRFYSELRNQIPLQAILSSMIIVPVLANILTELQLSIGLQYEDNLWFLSLEKQLNDRFKLSLIDDSLKEYGKSMFQLAQELINAPISEGLKTLMTGYGKELEGGE